MPFDPQFAKPIEWCIAYRPGHKCVLGHDVMATCALGQHGMRFTMACNTDEQPGFPKGTCKDFRTASKEIADRAAAIRAERRGG